MTTVLDFPRRLSRPPEIALLDWSGVFSRDQRPVYEANSRMLARRGIPVPPFDEWIGQTTASPRELFTAYGVTTSPEEIFAEHERTYGEVCAEGLLPEVYPEASWFFERLRATGVLCFVISAHPEEHLHAEAKRYGLFDLAHGFIGSVPDKAERIRLYASAAVHGEVVYIGDTVSDVVSAQKAGVIPIAAATGYHTRDKLAAANPFVIVDSLTECAHVLRI